MIQARCLFDRITVLAPVEDVRIRSSKVSCRVFDILEIVPLYGYGNSSGGPGVTRSWFKSQGLFSRPASLESVIYGVV